MYGEVYTWDSIETVELKEELPAIEMRTNGSALGSNLKGHFRTGELGSVKCLLISKRPLSFILKQMTGLRSLMSIIQMKHRRFSKKF